MKLFSISTSLNSRATSLYQIIRRQLLSSRSIPSRRIKNGSDFNPLYWRISPLGDPHLSMLPVLDGWIREGNAVNKQELQRVIEQLRVYKRFKHALEVSLWMTNKRLFHITPYDAAVRLKLIFKVFGLEKVENYFNKIPENLKTFSVYLALLNCYTMSKSVDKAESILQKARDLGYAINPIWYNLMMNLHQQLGNVKKLRDLLTEMEAKGIPYDSFTLSVCLSAFAGASDLEGMEKSLMIMESDPRINLDWKTCAIAAEGYWRMGSVGKALAMLKKLEGLLTNSKRKNNNAFVVLFNVYTKIGKKDELYRLWNLFKQTTKVCNKVYMSMMRSLVTFDDIDHAERIFEEWESSGLQIDFRIQNVLINAYCTHGLLEKAEALITKGISEGGNPVVATWVLLAGGYLRKNEVPKAVEALKKATSTSQPMYKLKNSLTTCLEFLESGAYMEKEEEFTKFVKMEESSLETVFDKLSALIKDGQLQSQLQLHHG